MSISRNNDKNVQAKPFSSMWGRYRPFHYIFVYLLLSPLFEGTIVKTDAKFIHQKENLSLKTMKSRNKNGGERRGEVIEVTPIFVELTLSLHSVTSVAADALASSNISDPVLFRFCSAVNQQVSESGQQINYCK